MREASLIVLVACLAVAGCGESKKRKQCEVLKERSVLISAGIAEQLQKWAPEEDRVDRATMEAQMREKLDKGTFIEECMKLDPEEVECLATARTKEEWVECGFDDQVLP